MLREEPGRTAVVNLAGRLVDVRQTAANVRDLRESRVRPTLALVEASRCASAPLAVWVQGSTTAIWSDAGETRVTDLAAPFRLEDRGSLVAAVAQPA